MSPTSRGGGESEWARGLFMRGPICYLIAAYLIVGVSTNDVSRVDRRMPLTQSFDDVVGSNDTAKHALDNGHVLTLLMAEDQKMWQDHPMNTGHGEQTITCLLPAGGPRGENIRVEVYNIFQSNKESEEQGAPPMILRSPKSIGTIDMGSSSTRLVV